MAKCRECGLLVWRPGCTAGGGDDFNTYVSDDDSDCPSFRRAKQKPLVEMLVEAVRELIMDRYTSGQSVGYRLGKAALQRYEEEVDDAKV